MKDKAILFILFVVLIISIDTALSITTDGVTQVFSFDTEYNYNSTLGMVGTSYQDTRINTSFYKLGDGSAWFNGTSYASYSTDFFSNPNNNHAWSCWLSPETVSVFMVYWVQTDGSQLTSYAMDILNDEPILSRLNGGSIASGASINVSPDWHHIVYIRNDSSSDLKNQYYINNMKYVPTQANQDFFTGTYTRRLFGKLNPSGSSGLRGFIDECVLFNYTLTSNDVDDLYNNGDGLAYPFTSPSPQIYISTDMQNNNSYNLESLYINYNTTIGLLNTNSTGDCYLNVNDAVNQSSLGIDINDTVNYFNLTFGQVEQEYNISITCQNQEATDNTATFTYYVDTIPPELQISSTFTNNTGYTQFDTLAFTINFTDTNLFAVNVSIFDANGAIWDSNQYFEENLTTTLYQFNLSKILTDLGNYSIRAEAWDSHTAIEIDNIEWSYNENFNELYVSNLVFMGDFIIKDGQDRLATYFYKDVDRYKLKVTFENQSTVKEIRIRARDWKYIGDMYGYKGHFISLKYNQWLDFEGSNVDTVTVIEEGNDVYLIRVKLISESDEIEFESIGSLNYESKIWYYSVSSSSSLSIDLTNIENYLSEIANSISMLWVVILYLGLFFGSLYTFFKGSLITGGFLFLSSLGLDMLIVSELYSNFKPSAFSTGFQNIYVIGFLVILSIYIILKVLAILSIRPSTKMY